MFLVDTNIFLEILLKRNKKEKCKSFLEKHKGELNITDFSLHSIGVILFKYNKENIFLKFLQDIFPEINLLSLPEDKYNEIVNTKKELKLDFDDAYQYSIAKYYGLKIATMDRDFKKVRDVEIIFL